MKNIYEIYSKIRDFWRAQGAIEIPPYNACVGAGTFHPKCFFGSLSKQHSAYVYLQKSTRKADGRYGESPNRLLNHHQIQVIFTPEPEKDIKQLFLDCLNHIGLDNRKNSIIFNENDWENISLGAIGVGWEVLCNNTEICQFTYFQKMGDVNTYNNTVEMAFGLERLAFAIFNQSIFDIAWDGTITYKDLFFKEEYEKSKYFLELNEVNKNTEALEKQCLNLIEKNLLLPAYDLLIEIIDVFNSLDAKKSISQIQRKEYISKTRMLANMIAESYVRE